jgi:hypothetical protein
MLGRTNIRAVVGETPESREKVEETRGVHEGSRVAPNLSVVALAIQVPFHFLHICHPVDFGVGYALDNDDA